MSPRETPPEISDKQGDTVKPKVILKGLTPEDTVRAVVAMTKAGISADFEVPESGEIMSLASPDGRIRFNKIPVEAAPELIEAYAAQGITLRPVFKIKR